MLQLRPVNHNFAAVWLIALLFFNVRNLDPCAFDKISQYALEMLYRHYPERSVVRQISRVSNLSADRKVLDDRIRLGLTLCQNRSSLCVLHRLPESHQLSSQGEMCLEGSPRCDDTRCRSLSKQIPGIEPRPVLNGSVDLISAYRGRGEFEEMSDERRVCLTGCQKWRHTTGTKPCQYRTSVSIVIV